MPGIKKLVRYILNYPSYKIEANIEISVSFKRKFFENFIKLPFKISSLLLPKRIRDEIYSPELIASDKKLQLNTSMIALRKIKEDNRPWNWHNKF